MAQAGSTAAINPENVARTLDDHERIGNRYHGTPGEARCRDYVAERFVELELEDVRLEPFTYLAYEPKSAACTVLSPGSTEIPCRAVQFSAAGQAEGEAVYIGTGTEEDFTRLDALGVDLHGKMVVAHSIAPFMVAPFLDARGIAGLVNVAETPDGIVGNFTAALYRPSLASPWEGRPVPYPAVTIEANAARELISTLTAGRSVAVRVEHDADYLEKEANNVVGSLPGSGEGQVLVGGHYDCQAEGPCIWDNGTGIACVLEIARALRGGHLARSVVFVAFAVEEVGLWGSTAYTERHADELPRVAGMVNLDAVASAYPAKRTIWADEAMSAFAAECAELQDWPTDIMYDARQSAFSDNTPFTDAGVPACWVWEFPPIHPYYHSAGDVRDLIDPARVARTGSVSLRIAQRLTEDASISLGRAGEEVRR